MAIWSLVKSLARGLLSGEIRDKSDFLLEERPPKGTLLVEKRPWKASRSRWKHYLLVKVFFSSSGGRWIHFAPQSVFSSKEESLYIVFLSTTIAFTDVISFFKAHLRFHEIFAVETETEDLILNTTRPHVELAGAAFASQGVSHILSYLLSLVSARSISQILSY